jgi:hypothetical protein
VSQLSLLSCGLIGVARSITPQKHKSEMEMEVVEERKVPPNETEDFGTGDAKNNELLENQQSNLVANGDDSHSADSAHSGNDNNISSPTSVSSPRLGFTSHFLLSGNYLLLTVMCPSHTSSQSYICGICVTLCTNLFYHYLPLFLTCSSRRPRNPRQGSATK